MRYVAPVIRCRKWGHLAQLRGRGRLHRVCDLHLFVSSLGWNVNSCILVLAASAAGAVCVRLRVVAISKQPRAIHHDGRLDVRLPVSHPVCVSVGVCLCAIFCIILVAAALP